MKPHGSFIRIALIAALVWVAVSLAAEPPQQPPDEVNLEHADRLVFNNRTRQGEAIGHVVMRHEDGTLYADRVQFDLKRKTATASGKVKFSNAENTVTADQVASDFGERRAIFHGKVELVNVRPQPKSEPPVEGEKPTERPMWSGRTVITCDELDYYYRQKKALATGHLKIVQLAPPSEEASSAPPREVADERTTEGKVATWDGKAETIVISGEVKVVTTKGENFQFQQATINLRDDTLEAQGPAKAHLLIED